MVQSAKDIAGHILEETGQGLLTRDPARFVPHFLTPHKIIAPDGVNWLNTEEDLTRKFHDVSALLHEMGVTDLIRYIVAAEFVSDTEMTATHESHTMVGNTRTKDPYPVFSTYRLTDGQWRIATSEYGLPQGSKQADVLIKDRADRREDDTDRNDK